ncbi:MAG: hypothetical protein CMF52_03310 [Legionellales bacterium]|nr:hypothetical protein [Legionellales bacterium]|tara:strand:- start:502 stop:828 length:327 start_codon:yes stop_codon:yes gene_type:complete
MGKKRRIIARGTKFGTKYASHPASGGVATTTPTTTTSNSERISAIAQKVETIEREVAAAEEQAETVVSSVLTEPTEEAAPEPTVRAPAKTRRTTKARKTRTTSKTTKK